MGFFALCTRTRNEEMEQEKKKKRNKKKDREGENQTDRQTGTSIYPYIIYACMVVLIRARHTTSSCI